MARPQVQSELNDKPRLGTQPCALAAVEPGQLSTLDNLNLRADELLRVIAGAQSKEALIKPTFIAHGIEEGVSLRDASTRAAN
jgi:hypothetical protein